MANYILKPSVGLEFQNNELIIIDVETGFMGSGNKCSYEILNMLNNPVSKDEIVIKMKSKYSENVHDKIEGAIQTVLKWALEKEVILEVE